MACLMGSGIMACCMSLRQMSCSAYPFLGFNVDWDGTDILSDLQLVAAVKPPALVDLEAEARAWSCPAVASWGLITQVRANRLLEYYSIPECVEGLC